jgi:hypothetical protein
VAAILGDDAARENGGENPRSGGDAEGNQRRLSATASEPRRGEAKRVCDPPERVHRP